MNNKLNDGVGKKIVEALKKQSEGELPEIVETPAAVDGLIPSVDEAISQEKVEPTSVPADFSNINTFDSDVFAEKEVEPEVIQPQQNMFMEDNVSNSFADINLDAFEDEVQTTKFTPEINDLEMPSNIVILKKLISQLPSGVTRHTGAQIIKQTMEALGISMKNVLKEAQDVQDNLKESAKECQATIQEYRKQIAALEKQSQNYQKQYGALNDLISLFIQTTK